MTSDDPSEDCCAVDSPVGRLRADFLAGKLRRLTWTAARPVPAVSAHARRLADQLAHYFAGTLNNFDIDINAAGTPFQRAVWAEMRAIPYGETRTYGALANALGSSARAVGVACGANPIPIVVPCHRIVGADGPGGFSGGRGTETKLALLHLEGAHLPAVQFALQLPAV